MKLMSLAETPSRDAGAGAPSHFWISLRDGRGLLLPASSRRAALAALQLYNAQSLKARALKALVKGAIYSGLAPRLLPTHTLANQSVQSSLFGHIQSVLNHRDLQFGVSLGTPGLQRKPTVLALTPNGATVGYAKYGREGKTRALVKNEATTLATLHGLQLNNGRFPTVLHAGPWRDGHLLITEPLSLENGRQPLSQRHISFLTEIADKTRTESTLGDSQWFNRLQAEIESLQPSAAAYQISNLKAALKILSDQLAGVSLPFVQSLGDFAPWNLGADDDTGQLIAIDVEYGRPACLPGWDLFHFMTQVNAAPKDQIAAIYDTDARLVKDYFAALGIDAAWIPYLHIAYLLDVWAMWAKIWQEAPKSTRALRGFRVRATTIAMLMLMLRANHPTLNSPRNSR